LFLWQMPHFYALAWMYRDDYRRAGFRLLSVDDTNGDRTVRQILGFTIAMVLASALPTLVGLSGIVYLVGALALGIAFYVVAHRFARERNRRNALRVFLGSVTYLPPLLVLLVLDRLFFYQRTQPALSGRLLLRPRRVERARRLSCRPAAPRSSVRCPVVRAHSLRAPLLRAPARGPDRRRPPRYAARRAATGDGCAGHSPLPARSCRS